MNKLELLRHLKSYRWTSLMRLSKPLCPQSVIHSAAQGGGMTLLEMLLAMSMLVVFTGVVVMVMEFTNRFFLEAEGNGKGV